MKKKVGKVKNIRKVIVNGGNSSGGYEYNVLSTPTEQNYKVQSLKQIEIGNDIYYHGYMRASEIRLIKMPLDANPRKPSPTRVVRIMQKTLQERPQDFHHLNNGITIIASNVEINSSYDEMIIEFAAPINNYGDGICNGGHTYYAVEQYQATVMPDALIRFEILVLDPQLSKDDKLNKLKDISSARNAHNELDSSTIANFLDYYKIFIESLGNNSVFFKWYEGDPNSLPIAEKSTNLIPQLTSLSPFWFSHYTNASLSNSTHQSASRSPGSVHSSWMKTIDTDPSDPKNLFHLVPMLGDIMLLRDHIKESLLSRDFKIVSAHWNKTLLAKYLKEKKTKTKFLKDINGVSLECCDLPHTATCMLLGAFRSNVWFSIDDDINLVGWLINPFELWDRFCVKHLINLNNIAKGISGGSFGNAFIFNPAIYSYQLAEYEFGSQLISKASSPEVLYDLKTGKKYEKIKAQQKATHYLKINKPIQEGANILAELLPLKGKSISGSKYIEV